MERVERSIYIEAPPEAVFDFVCDLKRIPEYVDFVIEIFDIQEHPEGVGTTYREWAKPGPIQQLQEWRCTVFERPWHQTYEGRSKQMAVMIDKRIEPEGNGTRYTQWMDFQMLPNFRLFGRLLDPLVRSQMEVEFTKIANGIKRIVEGEFARKEIQLVAGRQEA